MEKRIIITIGRQFGSGGKQVASAIGERLGIPVYDQELIVSAANKSGLSPEFIRQSDEHRHLSGLGGILGLGRFWHNAGNLVDDNELFRIQSEAIRDLASQGSAVFVGRASDYVLRDMDTVDVFICAPIEARTQRVAERLGISPEDAVTLIEKKDKTRKEYYDLFTLGDNWGVASNYDLCIDSSVLGIEGTSELIIQFVRQAELRKM
ncbi:MAG: cytidylate kinase-like family protein [Bacteroidales bacterium]|nr:cytidylate kinase-like family protein [Bacteroidales bacterium]